MNQRVMGTVLACLLSFPAHAGSINETYKRCEQRATYVECEKLEAPCDSGNGKACYALANYWASLNDRKETTRYVDLSCQAGYKEGCRAFTTLMKQESAMLQQAQLAEIQRQQLAERQAQQRQIEAQEREIASQRQGEAIVNGLQMMNNTMQQLSQPTTPQRPQPTRCRTYPRQNVYGQTEYITDCN